MVFATIYWISIPSSFNTEFDNRKYFDSDGEFITRQFDQGKIFTHNDHLLYHILGKAIYNSSEKMKTTEDFVTPHKLLSVFFGALGVVFFYAFGVLITKRTALSLVCAVFAGGTASWWFFSSTIDTYIPSLSVSIPVLGLAVLALNNNFRHSPIAIGAIAGLAFLFRTDSFLLALLVLFLLMNREKLLYNTVSTVATGIVVSVLGYAILSTVFYDIGFNPRTMWEWMIGSTIRPESGSVWGQTANLTPYNVALTFVNQLFYSILLPGLLETRGTDFYLRYAKGGWIPLLIWLGVFSTAIVHLCKAISKERRDGVNTTLFASILAGIWFFSRMLFYTWWDPFDPFLFAVMALPAIWLVLLLGFNHATDNTLPRKKVILYWYLIGLMTLTVWLHNVYYMIAPLREA